MQSRISKSNEALDEVRSLLQQKACTLTGEYEQAAVDLRETQERLRDKREDRRSCLKRVDSFEVRLVEARAEHATLANVER